MIDRRRKLVAALCAAIVVVELALAGAWHSWEGGWSWGPRLLVPTLPLWLLPAAFWLRGCRADTRFGIVVVVTVVSTAVQVPGILVKDQQIHQIKETMLTPEEQAAAYSDFFAAPILLRDKLTGRDEVYKVSELGAPGNREVDLRGFRTFQGLDVWTEHLARRFHKPALRWLPSLALMAVAYLVRVLVRHRIPA